MSFDITSAPATDPDRGSSPPAFAESHWPLGARTSRDDWHTLLERWEQVQPYADRFATAFFDTLFVSGADFREIVGSGSLEVQFVRLAHVLTQIVCADDDRDEMSVRVELIVRRFTRDDSDTRQLRALRVAVAATIREVAGSNMSRETLASWHSAYAAIGALLRGTTYLDTRGVSSIRRAAVRAEVAADRALASIDRHREPSSNAEAA